jgi:hypothetical protein
VRCCCELVRCLFSATARLLLYAAGDGEACPKN